MKSDEGIFKMLSKSSIIRNQYENVIISTQTKIQKGQFLLPFFLCKFYKNIYKKNDKLFKCQKDTVENHLRTQA